MLLVQIIHIIIGLYIFLLALRIFTSGTGAFHDPLLSVVYRATDPIMAPIQRSLKKKPRRLDQPDLTPLIPILLLVTFDGLLLALFQPARGIIGGIASRFLSFVDYAFLIFVLLLLIFSAFYKYARFPTNPFLRTGFKIMEPAYTSVGKLGSTFREYSGVTLFVIGFFVFIIVLSLLMPFEAKGLLAVYLNKPAILMALAAQHSIETLLSLATFFMYVIIISALMSWISPDPTNPIVQILKLLSEPINRIFRRIIPTIGGIDISPIFSILALQLITQAGHQLIQILFLAPVPVIPNVIIKGGLL